MIQQEIWYFFFCPAFDQPVVRILTKAMKNLFFQAYISNLTTESRYDLSVTAFVESHTKPGTFYQSEASPVQRVSLGETVIFLCEITVCYVL